MFPRHMALGLAVALIASAATAQTEREQVWRLDRMDGQVVDTTITLVTTADSPRISGQAPCNRYFGMQTASAPDFEVTGIGATRMACPDLPLETLYFQALSAVTRIEQDAETLTLWDGDTPRLVFVTAAD